MQRFFETFSWVFLTLFAVPTFLIMGSWNSLPGDLMYPVKLGLEHTLLFVVSPSYNTEAALNVKYTQNRFNEAKVLLASDQSGKGLSYLSQQIVATQEVINRAPNPEVRQQLASQYVAQLQTVSTELNQQKQQIVSGSSNSVAVSNTSVMVPTKSAQVISTPYAAPTEAVSAPVVPAATHEVVPTAFPTLVPTAEPTALPTMEQTASNDTSVVSQIDQTQQQINETIQQLQNSDTSGQNNQNNNNSHGQNSEHDSQQNNQDHSGSGNNGGDH